MNKSDLNKLFQYVPYGLYVYNGIHKAIKVSPLDFMSGAEEYFERFKPILRSMDDFKENKPFETKNGIVYPIHYLHYKSYKIVGSKARVEPEIITCRDFISTMKHPASYGVCVHTDNIVGKNEYWINRQLIEWGFDLDRFIERELAIDINSLKQPIKGLEKWNIKANYMEK